MYAGILVEMELFGWTASDRLLMFCHGDFNMNKRRRVVLGWYWENSFLDNIKVKLYVCENELDVKI